MTSQELVTIEHEAAFNAVGVARHLLLGAEETLRRLVRSAEMMESVGIVLDPTLLQKYLHSKDAQTQVRVARLVLKFLGDLDSEVAAFCDEQARKPRQA